MQTLESNYVTITGDNFTDYLPECKWKQYKGMVEAGKQIVYSYRKNDLRFADEKD